MAKVPSKNHQTSTNFEKFVHSLIHQNFDGIDGVDLLETGHNVKMTGLSGYTHQIDVMYRFRIWSVEFLVVVECKQYAHSVGVGQLLEFKSRMEDLRAHKGVFVTSSGYQEGAVTFAAANKIALLVVQGTKHWFVSYLIMSRSLWEELEWQSNNLAATYKLPADSFAQRVRIASDHVLVTKDGVSIRLKPRDLHVSMLYRKCCDIDEAECGPILKKPDSFDSLDPHKLLKLILLDELLAPPEQPAP